jgi:hypothetical protein
LKRRYPWKTKRKNRKGKLYPTKPKCRNNHRRSALKILRKFPLDIRKIRPWKKQLAAFYAKIGRA